MDYIKLGKRIRVERQKHGLTQEKLAECIEISDSYMGQIERGERSLALDTLVRLVNRLGVTIDYLLSDSVIVKDSQATNELLQLMDGKSSEEKRMAVDVIRVMFGHLNDIHK